MRVSASQEATDRMRIEVVSGGGEGRTAVGAFDAALADAGIADYNLVEFSSIIPPDATVVTRGTYEGAYPVGTPVGVVLASAHADPGRTAAAGLGWVIAVEGGVLMETGGDSEATCRESLRKALADARQHRNWDWTHDEMIIRSFPAEGNTDRRSAVVVAAVYEALQFAESG